MRTQQNRSDKSQEQVKQGGTFFFKERVSVGTVPTNKMHPVGAVPTYKLNSVGIVPTYKMHPVGTLFLPS